LVDPDGAPKYGTKGAPLALDDWQLRRTWPDPERAATVASSDGLTPQQEFRRAFERLQNGKTSFIDGVDTVMALHDQDGWATAMEAGISPEAIRPMVSEMREALDGLVAILPVPNRLRRGILPSVRVPFEASAQDDRQ